MGLLVFFLGLLGLFLKPAIYVDSAAILPPLSKYVVKDAGDPIGVPCTKNVSNAWLDIVVAIDISTNMGPSQVRQITLQLSSELRKYPIGQNGKHYTRVAIITYATQATIVANLTTFSTPDQLYTAITGITGSTSDSGSDMSDAVTQAYNILYNEQPCDQVIGCEKLGRPAVFVLFAASGSGNTANVLQNGQNIQQFGSIITINYKPTDATLTNLLNQLASPSFSFPKSWTTSDLDWALTQSNCLCPWWSGTQLLVLEPSTQRYNRYAECFSIWELLMGPVNLNDTDICGDSSTGFPVALNAKDTSDFIKKLIHDEIPNAFYIGLHRQGMNPTGPWKWYTFNGNDMPMTSFTDWAPDANSNAAQNCVLEKRLPGSTLQNETIGWEPASCELFDTGVTNCICSLKACSTDYLCPTTLSFMKDRKNAKTMPTILNPKNMPKSTLKVNKH